MYSKSKLCFLWLNAYTYAFLRVYACAYCLSCLVSLMMKIFLYSLPWQGLKAATKKQKYDKICEKKLSTPIEVCVAFTYPVRVMNSQIPCPPALGPRSSFGFNYYEICKVHTGKQVQKLNLNWLDDYFLKVLCKSHPVEFASYFHYCHSLTFDQRPDYGFLKRLFHDLFSREGIGWWISVTFNSMELHWSENLNHLQMPKCRSVCCPNHKACTDEYFCPIW